MDDSGSPSVPISWGELLDKLTILEIKRERIVRRDALANVEKELALLAARAVEVMEVAGVEPLVGKLKRVNKALWEIEDAIREQEAEADFGAGFVALARSVYKTNDERAALKRRINALLDSDLTEEKSYADAPADAAAPSRLFAEPASPPKRSGAGAP
ncbi:DUF6165 family protein [Sphingomonas gilva]|uniref:DUF6165 family protein n=1 Tax=Sphingomonas gilva TaxID=2305907 RepID=UPI001CA3A4E8|nr:DUF6165 family protein [Sphingomonas gilva]